MRVYLACTVRGDRDSLPAVRAILDGLARHGHEVLTEHLLRDDVEEVESALSDGEVYERDMRWLASCDALVAEASGSSYGVGFEVASVLAAAERTGQRVFVFYDAARRGRVSRLVSGNTHPRCMTFGYSTVEEVARFIDEHFARGAATADGPRRRC
jgi:hypothetical protein